MGGGSDDQGQVRRAAGAGTTGRTPESDSGWEKLGPSDRQGADSPQERRVGPLPRWPRRWMWRWAPCTGLSSALPRKGWTGPCGTGARSTGIGSWTTGAKALACSPAPEGHDHWTLRLLAGKVVELGLASSMSHEGCVSVSKKRSQAVAEAGVVHPQGERRVRGQHGGRAGPVRRTV